MSKLYTFNQKTSAILLFLICIVFNQVGSGQWYKKITDAGGSIINSGVKITTAPYQSLMNAGKVLTGNGNASQIYQPYKDLAKSVGGTTQQLGSLGSDPQNYLYQKAEQFAQQAGGESGAFIFDVATFTNQYYNELANAGVQNLGATLQGKNILEISAAPLAAALRAARESHLTNSHPIPDDVKNALRGRFSDQLLAKARYAIGTLQITLPNFIGKGQAYMGGNHSYAVVVGEIIVFNSAPPAYADQSFWWAHEMTHVEQFNRLGFETFAYRYLVSAGSEIEGEADATASQITGNRTQRTVSLASIAGSYDMTGASSTTNYSLAPEFFVSQCIFPYDTYRVNYLVTNYGRIIAVDPISGQWVHIGHATPPLAPGVAWSYQTPNIIYPVYSDGRIMGNQPVYNQFGQIVGNNVVQIGHVIRF